MTVLKTVDEGRRRVRRALVVSVLALLVALGGPTSWWAIRGGEPVESALGVEVPYGTRQVFDERIDVEPTGAYASVYLASTLPVSALEERFSDLAVADTEGESRRFHLDDGTIITVAPSFEIPATRLSPVREVADDVPLGARSWIIIERGTPPESTLYVAVPPLGES